MNPHSKLVPGAGQEPYRVGANSWLNRNTGRSRLVTAVPPQAPGPSSAEQRWSQAGGQAERGEHRWLLEGGDVGQAAVLEAQYGEHEREERGLAGSAEGSG